MIFSQISTLFLYSSALLFLELVISVFTLVF